MAKKASKTLEMGAQNMGLSLEAVSDADLHTYGLQADYKLKGLEMTYNYYWGRPIPGVDSEYTNDIYFVLAVEGNSDQPDWPMPVKIMDALTVLERTNSAEWAKNIIVMFADSGERSVTLH